MPAAQEAPEVQLLAGTNLSSQLPPDRNVPVVFNTRTDPGRNDADFRIGLDIGNHRRIGVLLKWRICEPPLRTHESDRARQQATKSQTPMLRWKPCYRQKHAFLTETKMQRSICQSR